MFRILINFVCSSVRMFTHFSWTCWTLLCRSCAWLNLLSRRIWTSLNIDLITSSVRASSLSIWVQLVDPLCLVFDPSLDVVQLGVGHLCLLVDLLRKLLQLFQTSNLLLDHGVPFLEQHHQLAPRPFDVIGVEVAVQLKVGVLHLSLDIPEDSKQLLFFTKPWWYILLPESVRVFGKAFHFDKCVGEVTVLHNGSVLPDPLVERGGKLFKLLKLFLRLRVKERVARWRFWEHVIQLGDIRNDRLLVRFGGIDIFWVEKSGHSVFPVHDMEGEIYPFSHLPSLHLPPVQQVGSVSVDDGIEGETVP